MSSNNNRYDDEFKGRAVKMVVEKGRPISDVARDIGVSEPALRRWIKASTEPEDATSEKLAKLEDENIRLKKELDDKHGSRGSM
ncbi:transposase [Alkaliphilus peptidifermentans]|uniref:Transposase n=1 Tax=Alkaliphilus peptidifermentans DSM 18978 TaxID=1120976 RepID=A0A1G5KV53_9FIRM|nr:transposase [Alkaliphilus peptidifermentans]SCZ03809.1 transposase [Alkaliphilus peptidifermentans DSM 18978]